MSVHPTADVSPDAELGPGTRCLASGADPRARARRRQLHHQQGRLHRLRRAGRQQLQDPERRVPLSRLHPRGRRVRRPGRHLHNDKLAARHQPGWVAERHRRLGGRQDRGPARRLGRHRYPSSCPASRLDVSRWWRRARWSREDVPDYGLAMGVPRASASCAPAAKSCVFAPTRGGRLRTLRATLSDTSGPHALECAALEMIADCARGDRRESRPRSRLPDCRGGRRSRLPKQLVTGVYYKPSTSRGAPARAAQRVSGAIQAPRGPAIRRIPDDLVATVPVPELIEHARRARAVPRRRRSPAAIYLNARSSISWSRRRPGALRDLSRLRAVRAVLAAASARAGRHHRAGSADHPPHRAGSHRTRGARAHGRAACPPAARSGSNTSTESTRSTR